MLCGIYSILVCVQVQGNQYKWDPKQNLIAQVAQDFVNKFQKTRSRYYPEIKEFYPINSQIYLFSSGYLLIGPVLSPFLNTRDDGCRDF